MAISKTDLLKSYSSPDRILELVSHLISRGQADFVIGGPGSGTKLTNADILDLIDDYQRNTLLQTEILTLNKDTNYRLLYTRILGHLGQQLETKVPDRETRESLINNYRKHLREIDNTTPTSPRVKLPELSAQLRSAEAYYRQQYNISSSVTSALDALADRETLPSSAKAYLRLERNKLEHDILASLKHIDTSNPLESRAEIAKIINSARNSSRTWSTLHTLLISNKTDYYGELAQDVGVLVSQQKISRDQTAAYEKDLNQIKSTSPTSFVDHKNNIEKSINSWQQTYLGKDRATTSFTDDVLSSLRSKTIDQVEKPSLIDSFLGQDTQENLIRQAIADNKIAQKYHLSNVDVDRLTEEIAGSEGVNQYIRELSSGLTPGRAALFHLSPLSTTAYIAKNSGLPPDAINLLRRGYSWDQTSDWLSKQGVKPSDLRVLESQYHVYFNKSGGIIENAYKLRLSFDNRLAKIRSALSPQNLPVIGNILRSYASLTESIGNWYNGVLNNHSTFAFLVSQRHRFLAFTSWIEKGIASRNLPSWFRRGLSFYKDGGYSVTGFWGEFRKYYRIKLGSWMVERARAGGEKLSSKFIAWIGAGLVTGTLSGGVGFAIQAGLWFASQVGKAPKAIGSADIAAGWALKNIAGLAVLTSMFGTTFLFGLIGAILGSIAFFFGLITGPAWLIIGGFTAAGLGLGYLVSHAGAIASAIGGWASGIGAGLSSWWGGLLSAAGSASGAVLGTTITAITSAFLFSGFYNSASMTASLSPAEFEARSSASNNSPHLSVVKEVTAILNGAHHIENTNLVQTLHYTITVSAVDIPLTGAALSDTASTFNKDGQKNVLEKTENIGDLAVGDVKVFSYDLPLNSSFADSSLTNTVTVTATSANGKETSAATQSLTIGTPPLLPIAAFAQKLAAAINTCYGATVTLSDGGTCLTNLHDPQITSAVISTLLSHIADYHYLQCVIFTQAVLVGTNSPLLGSANYAYEYITHPPAGFTAIHDGPMPGDLFVFPSRPGAPYFDTPGHIGIVISVSGPTMVVADANWNGTGQTRPNGTFPTDLVGIYLRPNP